ncbi:SpvB/TcaC N-terminal domain-containing protein, partial [Streptomyces sp. NPDC005574]|uniref:SpvB/TcaC N-terminal domain-containing protein n=1 Tax=Streptomyces sp. NPDC005574 TaxID=3156891 RepID=UPI0033BD3F4E
MATKPGLPPGPVLAAPGTPVSVAVNNSAYLPGSSQVGSDGSYSYSIPFAVPQGRSGVQPGLSLEYSSGGGNGLLGMGWSLAGLSAIGRCAKTKATEGVVAGVKLDSSDAFCLNGQKLVTVKTGDNAPKGNGEDGAEYRTEADKFSRIISHVKASNAGSGPDTFTEETRDGRTRVFTAFTADQVKAGVNLDAVSPAEGDSTTTAKRVVWLETSEVDHSGNAMDFTYKQVPGTGTFNPDEIHYTSNTSNGNTAEAKRYVKFEYEAGRPDVVQHFQAGVSYKQTQRLAGVSMWAPNPANVAQVWRYNLAYQASSTGQSLLSSVQRCDKDSNGCTRSKKFDWYDRAGKPTFTASSQALSHGVNGSASGKVADYDGDGVDDLLYAFDNGGAVAPELRMGARPASGGKAPLESKFGTSLSSDHFSDGRPLDLEADGKLEYAPSSASGGTDKIYRWNSTSHVFEDTGKTVPSDHSDFGDLDGDGLMDLIGDDQALFGHDMTFRLNTGNGFGPYVQSTFAGGPQTSGNGQGEWCHLRVLDTDGDGRAELVGNELVGGVCAP